MTTTIDSDVLRTIGDYELLALIGKGGMGTVYKSRHGPSGQTVAVKVVPSENLNNQVLVKRFEQEFLAAKALEHPNVVRALDYRVGMEETLLVMEFVEGE